ncbi:MAPEG family protein [Devosia submarina]|uniref:MAPEG family protein n=1 Tax=Devosia submarina TaxID=1173082 RepID=UPI0013006C9A|nr:MAPEG family protein [Devosia submarina]
MTPNAKLLVLAIAAQVLLTLIILLLMGRERVPRVKSGEIAVADIAVDRTAYPLRARLLSNSFDNQFQLPVLFYLATILTLVCTSTSWIELVLAWLFVALRYAHAFVHVTTNRVYRRFALYTAGLAVLALLWLWLVLRLLVLTPSV